MKSYSYDKDFVEAIELELTSACNLNCPLCARNYEEAQHLLTPYSRPLSEIIAQLDEYPNIKKCCLAGILSEPTLYPELFGLIKYLNSRNIQTELYSNGNTHDEVYWEQLGTLTNELNTVIFTVCGSTQEIHERYRRGSDLQQLLRHHLAYKRGNKCGNDYLQHIMFEYNRDDFENMDEIRSQFTNECNIDSLPYNTRFTNINDLPPEMDQRYELLAKYKTIHEFGKSRFGKNTEIRCKSHDEKFIAFDNMGRTYPCFLYRVFNTDHDWHLDYTDILNYKHEFCLECEKLTCTLLDGTEGLERMG